MKNSIEVQNRKHNKLGNIEQCISKARTYKQMSDKKIEHSMCAV